MDPDYQLVPFVTGDNDKIPKIINIQQITKEYEPEISSRRPKLTATTCLSEQCHIPNDKQIHNLTGLLLTILLGWTAMYTLTTDAIRPDTDPFKLGALVLVSYVAGVMAAFIGLPHVVGMYAAGSAIRSIGWFELSPTYQSITVILRLLAISVTITKSGLGLDINNIIKYKWPILKLSFFPCTIEAIIFAILARFFFQFPWLWALLFGYAIGPMSSSQSINTLANLKSQGLYDNGRMKAIIASAAYIDNIYAISAFTVCLTTINYSNDNIFAGISHGLLDLLVGSGIGIFLGFLTGFFPHRNDVHVLPKRCLSALINGTCTYFGCKLIGFPAGGALSCFMAAVTSTYCWTKQGWSAAQNPVCNFECQLWSLLMEPMLFGLVGTEVNVRELNFMEIGTALWMFILLILVRGNLGLLIFCGENFSLKEKIYISVSWMPKTTVQTALAPQVLDMVRRMAGDGGVDYEMFRMANTILRVSMLAVIVITTASLLVIRFANGKLLVLDSKKKASSCS